MTKTKRCHSVGPIMPDLLAGCNRTALPLSVLHVCTQPQNHTERNPGSQVRPKKLLLHRAPEITRVKRGKASYSEANPAPSLGEMSLGHDSLETNAETECQPTCDMVLCTCVLRQLLLGTAPAEKCPATCCLPQHLSSVLGEHQELLQPCSFPKSSHIQGGQSTAQAPCCEQTTSCPLQCVMQC